MSGCCLCLALQPATAAIDRRASPRTVDQPWVVGMLGCPACIVVQHIAKVLYADLCVGVECSVSVKKNMVAKDMHSWTRPRRLTMPHRCAARDSKGLMWD